MRNTLEFSVAWTARIGILACVLVLAGQAAELTPAGTWKTVDDRTGKPRGVVRIYEDSGRFFGKIDAALDPKEEHLRCRYCRGERKDQPVIGLLILRNMKPGHHAGEFEGGDILDPETGMVYRCLLRLADDGNKLIVRGYIGFSIFGRSQQWFRQP